MLVPQLFHPVNPWKWAGLSALLGAMVMAVSLVSWGFSLAQILSDPIFYVAYGLIASVTGMSLSYFNRKVRNGIIRKLHAELGRGLPHRPLGHKSKNPIVDHWVQIEPIVLHVLEMPDIEWWQYVKERTKDKDLFEHGVAVVMLVLLMTALFLRS